MTKSINTTLAPACSRGYSKKTHVERAGYQVAINDYAKTGRKVESGPGVFVDAFDNVVPSVYNANTTLQVTISATASENRFDFGLEAK